MGEGALAGVAQWTEHWTENRKITSLIPSQGGTTQRECMKDPRRWTTVWELTVGVELGWVEESKGEKIGTTIIE